MNSGILDMFGYGILYHFSLVGYGIKLYLLRVLHELRHHNREVLAHLGCHLEESLQFVEAVANVHGGSREHV